MPLYVYACPECEVELEELRTSEHADDPVICPLCHGPCDRALPTFAIGRSASTRAATPTYGRVPATYHARGCGCCSPRRR